MDSVEVHGIMKQLLIPLVSRPCSAEGGGNGASTDEPLRRMMRKYDIIFAVAVDVVNKPLARGSKDWRGGI